jgi:hypothetical protein
VHKRKCYTVNPKGSDFLEYQDTDEKITLKRKKGNNNSGYLLNLFGSG